MRVIGVVSRSGARKTTLIVRPISELNRRGFSVSTIKHTRDDFDIDESGNLACMRLRLTNCNLSDSAGRGPLCIIS